MSVPGTEAGMAGYADERFDLEEERAEARFEEVRSHAEDRGMDLETETVVGRPARATVEYAEENEIDRIVMGSHGCEGASRVLLGSVRKSDGFSSQSEARMLLMTSPRPSSGVLPVR